MRGEHVLGMAERLYMAAKEVQKFLHVPCESCVTWPCVCALAWALGG